MTENTSRTTDAQYRVLARKYRPTTFAELVGQEVLVRTLTNAIELQRLAQAYVLTGVRGVGKTSTARIIARSLNCVGADGSGGPTVSPCGVCQNCLAIAEDRHMDVLEMDAASRTGVNDIRELIESVRYRPTMARYKIYIIDEVHMLSTQAFNAILKTLEEPPPHVKFIFATTEIRKVPVTVLSRCQRFDLRRVEMDVLAAHYAAIAAKEGTAVEESALRLIARAADGSVRDGLSLLDQAIAHTDGSITEIQVRDMMGLADRAQVFDLFDAVMRGAIREALDLLRTQYDAGADPAVVVQDLLELVHWLTRLKIVPEAADDPIVPQTERVRGSEMALRLTMPVLTRAWQMLLKALAEVRTAPSPLQAIEMALVRLAYVTDQPTPSETIDALKGGSSSGASKIGNITPLPPSPPQGGGRGSAAALMPTAAPMPLPMAPAPMIAKPDPQTFDDVVALVRVNREMRLIGHLTADVHLIHCEPGRLEFRPGENAPRDLAGTLGRLLEQWTGRRWMVSISNTQGEPTLKEREDATRTRDADEVSAHPLVRAVLDTFPGATIVEVRTLEPEAMSDDSSSDNDDEATMREDEL